MITSPTSSRVSSFSILSLVLQKTVSLASSILLARLSLTDLIELKQWAIFQFRWICQWQGVQLHEKMSSLPGQ